MNRNGLIGSVAAVAGMCSVASTAGAATITWYMTNIFYGTVNPVQPIGQLEVTIASLSATEVQLTLFANWSASSSQFLGTDGFYFNVNPILGDPSATYNIAHTGGQAPTAAFFSPVQYTAASAPIAGGNAYKADGDGFYDGRIQFDSDKNSGGRLTGQESSIYKITRDNGGNLAPEDFLFGSQGGTLPNTSYLAGAHVQGVAIPTGTTSMWMFPGESVIPLPTTAGMSLAGMFLLGLRRRRF